jgi:hypothetical protein
VSAAGRQRCTTSKAAAGEVIWYTRTSSFPGPSYDAARIRSTDDADKTPDAADVGSSLTDVRCHAPIASSKTSGIGAPPCRHAASASAHASRNWGRLISHDATIGVMAKFRPIRANAKKKSRPQGAAGCVILILLIMVGVMVFLYLVMKSNANG